MNADQTAMHLCERWQKSQPLRKLFTVDELTAFMSGVKAVLAIEDWRPIETLQSSDVDVRLVLWNPCDGVHLVSVVGTGPRQIELMKSEKIFTHWLRLTGPDEAPETVA